VAAPAGEDITTIHIKTTRPTQVPYMYIQLAHFTAATCCQPSGLSAHNFIEIKQSQQQKPNNKVQITSNRYRFIR
jgi:hypothetical protein